MDIAQKTFEINNSVQTIDPNDAVFKYDAVEQRALLNAEPWKHDPHWFKEVKISAVALIKMVIHARSGGQYEIMGLMNGKIHAPSRSFYVMDSFALPVQGTETRVNAGNEAMEYMVNFNGGNEALGKGELVVGWYHSHPGYGCWLSGIDVNTQSTNQRFSDPYLAVVIDPNRTVSAGKVEIGAFRTYPEGYTPPDASSSEYQSIPLDKVEDFGVHAGSYYPLKVSVFKSSLDTKLLELLWNKYWVNTLSQSTVVTSRAYNTAQLKDLTAKLSKTERDLAGAKPADKVTLTRKDVLIGPADTTSGGTDRMEDVAEESGKGQSSNGKGKGKGGADASIRWEEKETGLSQAAKDGCVAGALRLACVKAGLKATLTRLFALHIVFESLPEIQHGMIAQSLKDRLFNSDLRALPLLDPPTALQLARV